jgi:hypothetical protein
VVATSKSKRLRFAADLGARQESISALEWRTDQRAWSTADITNVTKNPALTVGIAPLSADRSLSKKYQSARPYMGTP